LGAAAALEEAATTVRETFGGGVGPCGGGTVCGHDGRPGGGVGGVGHGGDKRGRARRRDGRDWRGTRPGARRRGRAAAGTGAAWTGGHDGDNTAVGTGDTAAATVLRERKKQRDEPVRGAPRGFINI
jgi:hypothetical protein